jgi:galactosamine-6-phosphate isomerase
MQLLTVPNIADVASRAAGIVCEALAQRPDAHLCLAAGGTPRPLYGELCRRAEAGEAALLQARITKLDEWCGVSMDDPASCEDDLRVHLLTPLGIPAERYIGFDSMASDPEAECRRVADLVAAAGPFDLSVLGLGLNGHIGMNEPADELPPGVHVAKLAEQSRRHAMLREIAEPPTTGFTMGMADLMHSGKVLLIVTGEAKREALARLIHGPITTRFPASLLKLHRDCICIADATAAQQV